MVLPCGQSRKRHPRLQNIHPTRRAPLCTTFLLTPQIHRGSPARSAPRNVNISRTDPQILRSTPLGVTTRHDAVPGVYSLVHSAHDPLERPMTRFLPVALLATCIAGVSPTASATTMVKLSTNQIVDADDGSRGQNERTHKWTKLNRVSISLKFTQNRRHVVIMRNKIINRVQLLA